MKIQHNQQQPQSQQQQQQQHEQQHKQQHEQQHQTLTFSRTKAIFNSSLAHLLQFCISLFAACYKRPTGKKTISTKTTTTKAEAAAAATTTTIETTMKVSKMQQRPPAYKQRKQQLQQQNQQHFLLYSVWWWLLLLSLLVVSIQPTTLMVAAVNTSTSGAVNSSAGANGAIATNMATVTVKSPHAAALVAASSANINGNAALAAVSSSILEQFSPNCSSVAHIFQANGIDANEIPTKPSNGECFFNI